MTKSRVEINRDAYINHCEERKEYAREHYTNNREEILRQKYEHRRSVKNDVLTHYGNGKSACVMCGEDCLDCLTVDHINDNGWEERKALNIKSGRNFYNWLIKNGYPDGYQTLCANCNLKKEIIRRGKRIGEKYE